MHSTFLLVMSQAGCRRWLVLLLWLGVSVVAIVVVVVLTWTSGIDGRSVQSSHIVGSGLVSRRRRRGSRPPACLRHRHCRPKTSATVPLLLNPPMGRCFSTFKMHGYLEWTCTLTKLSLFQWSSSSRYLSSRSKRGSPGVCANKRRKNNA